MQVKAIFYLLLLILGSEMLHAEQKFKSPVFEEYYEDQARFQEIKEKRNKNKLIIDHFDEDSLKSKAKVELDKTKDKLPSKLSNLITISTPDAKGSETKSLINKAYKAYALGMTETAEHLYHQAYKLDKNNIEINLAIASFYINKGLWQKAQNIYQDIISKHPENIQALNNYMAVTAMENPEQAIYELKRLEAISPNLSIIPAHIGMAYYKLENYKKAVRFLHKALKLEPTNNSIKLNLAVSCEKDKRTDEATRLYQELLEAYNQGENITISPKMIVKRISKLNS